jgi:hypothetical protein
VPRQRNTDAEKKAIKEGLIPQNWKDKPAKLRQKDRDARWTGGKSPKTNAGLLRLTKGRADPM